MALEAGNYINDLVIANPLPADPKSQGDDHIRLLKTVIKKTLNGFTGAILVTAADTGTATGHILTPTTALVGYTPMLCLLYQPLVTNTGAVTVNVSGLGAKSIKTMAGADPTAGDLVAGYPMLLIYTGTNFITLAGAEFLSKTGSQTLTGNLTLIGNLIQTGDLALTGNATVSGTLAVTGATTLQAATGVTTLATDNSSNLATTEYATTAVAAEALLRSNADALLAPLASPNLTGVPTAPTAAAGTGTSQIASTAFVAAAAFSAVLPGQGGNAGKFVTTDGTNASWSDVGAATNLAGGSAGAVPYQSAAGATAMLPAGTEGQVLTSAGAAAPVWITPVSSFNYASLLKFS